MFFRFKFRLKISTLFNYYYVENIKSSKNILRRCTQHGFNRSIFSEAFQNDKIWKSRLNSSILSSIVPGDYVLKLNETLVNNDSISAIDIDILANKLIEVDPLHLEFTLNIIKLFRHNKEYRNVTASTHHAILRNLLELNEHDLLMQVLQNKIDYGIFLDNFSACLLLNHYIKSKQYSYAAKIAYDLMLQEKLDSHFVRTLSWHACALHLKNPNPQPADEQTTEADNGDEEPEYNFVRVKFIKHPWFDDHFDLKRENLLLGKTLVEICRYSEENLSLNYRFIGYGLHEKINDGLTMMKMCLDEGISLSNYSISSFELSLQEMPTKAPATSQKHPGRVTLEDVTFYHTDEEKQDLTTSFQDLKQQMLSKDLVSDTDITAELERVTLDLVSREEDQWSKDLSALYTHWDDLRVKLLDKKHEDKRVSEQKRTIEARLQHILATEEKLQFFEQQDKINLGLSRVPKRMDDFSDTSTKGSKEEEQYVLAPSERGRSAR